MALPEGAVDVHSDGGGVEMRGNNVQLLDFGDFGNSLFGGGCVLAVRSAQNAGKEVAAELARYARNPPPDVKLAGSNRS